MKNRLLALASLALVTSTDGLSAQDNIDCGYPLNQMERTYCAQKAWKQYDAELNATYQAAMATMRSLDASLPDH
ncbi:MAG: lysozyme inhibitor LprI family protein, partial [Roseibium sp.]